MNIIDTLSSMLLTIGFYIGTVTIYSIVKHYQKNKEGIVNAISKEFQFNGGNLVRRLRKHL